MKKVFYNTFIIESYINIYISDFLNIPFWYKSYDLFKKNLDDLERLTRSGEITSGTYNAGRDERQY